MKNAILGGILGLTLVCTHPTYALKVEGFSPDNTIVYKMVEGADLKLYIFNPSGHTLSDQSPAIIFFFGGGWKSGSPSQFYPQCAHLASRGMVAISAEYRVESTHRTSPLECVKDGKSAVRWVRQHAAELGIDPGKIAAGGGSAGGHVAAATGTLEDFDEHDEDLGVSARPDALVLFNPVFDNSRHGYGYHKVKEYWQAFSPMHNISEKTPPTIVFLGTSDRLIPVDTAKAYKRIMEEKGCRCDLHLYEGQPHGFFNFKNEEHFNRTVEQMDRFLVSLGFLVE